MSEDYEPTTEDIVVRENISDECVKEQHKECKKTTCLCRCHYEESVSIG